LAATWCYVAIPPKWPESTWAVRTQPGRGSRETKLEIDSDYVGSQARWLACIIA